MLPSKAAIVLRAAALWLTGILAAQVAVAQSDSQLELERAYAEFQQAVDENDFSTAAAIAESAAALAVELYGETSKAATAMNYNYGYSLLRAGQVQPAIKQLKYTSKLYRGAYGKQSVENVSVLKELGSAYALAGEYRNQSRATDAAVDIIRSTYGEDSLEYGRFAVASALRLDPIKHSRQSYRLLATGYAALTKQLGPQHPETAMAGFELGLVELWQGNPGAAEPLFRAALEAAELHGEEMPAGLATDSHRYLAQVYEQLGNADAVTEHCQAIGREQKTLQVSPRLCVQPNVLDLRKLHSGGGNLVIEFTVDDKGYVRDAHLAEGPERYEAQITTWITAARYVPGFRNGVPVTTHGVQYRIGVNIGPKNGRVPRDFPGDDYSEPSWTYMGF